MAGISTGTSTVEKAETANYKGVDGLLLGCFHELSSSSSKGSIGGCDGVGDGEGERDGEEDGGREEDEGRDGNVSEGVVGEGVLSEGLVSEGEGSCWEVIGVVDEDGGEDDSAEAGEEDGDGAAEDDCCSRVDEDEYRGVSTGCVGAKSRKKRGSQAIIASRLKKGWRAMKKGAMKKASATSIGMNTRALNGVSVVKQGKSKSSGELYDAKQLAWEDKQARLTSIWVNSVLPQWKKKRRSAKVRSLVFMGIPPSVRGKVWMTALGNTLNVNKDLFDVLKESAVVGREKYLKEKQTVERADGDIGAHGGEVEVESLFTKERSAHKAITLDLPRTFPHLAFFHAEGSNYRESLREILEAFVYLRPDIGYSQGMSFLVAVLLLYMPQEDAFKCFVNMMHKSCFLHFFKMKMPEVRIYLQVHTRLLAHHLPNLHAHFMTLNVEPELYMINWVMSLYCHALPLELTSRIWDLFVLDGDVAIFRVALGLLKYFSTRMLAMSFEDVAYLLNHLSSQDIQPDKLMKEVRSVQGITRKHFKDLYRDQEKKMAGRCSKGSSQASPAAHSGQRVVSVGRQR